MPVLHDKFGRAITDLRISITDRCNYKCVYCRTGNEGALYGDLPFDDYLRMARVLVSLGITKVRITGGEPLLRKGVVEFVRELAKLRPQGLKPHSLDGVNGMAEAMPFQSLPQGLKPRASRPHNGKAEEDAEETIASGLGDTGAKAPRSGQSYAALKRRASTVAHAFT